MLCLSPAAANAAPGYGTNVIGGSPAPAGEWPAMAALLARGVLNPYDAQFCGGTLINRHWVITAAHCVVDDSGSVAGPAQIDVAIGVLKLTEITPAQRAPIDRIEVNPGYSPSRFGNDVALLRLVNDATQTPRPLVSPADEGLVSAGRAAMVAGWGCSSPPGGSPPSCPSGGYPDALNQAAIQVQADTACSSVFGGVFNGTEMICAGDGVPNTCYGDSGGPLTITGSGGTKVLAGVTSFGDQHCAGTGDHGVYTRLSTYRSWINQVTAVSPASAPPAKAAPGPRQGEITVTWETPASDGDSLITAYRIESDPATGAGPVTAAASARSYTFTGLNTRTSYRFRVIAENTAGDSAPGVTAAVIPGRLTPAVFYKPAAGRIGSALSKGVREKIRCSRSCTARMQLQVSAATAARYGLGTNTTVGSARASLKSGRKTTVTAKFTSTARRKLKGARTLSLTVVSSATSSGYLAREKSWRLTLRR